MNERWKTMQLGEAVRFIDYRGRTPKKTESGMRLITAKNVKRGYLQIEPQEFVKPEIYDEWMTRGIPQEGDVLFTTEAPLGNVAQLDTSNKVVFAQRVIVFQPNRDLLESTFLKYMLLSNFMQQQLNENSSGATVKGIKASLLKKILIFYPPIPEQKRIVTILDEAFAGIDAAVANTEKNLANARELFESYLNGVFTQKGDGWVEKKLGELCNRMEYGTSSKSMAEGSIPVLRMGNIQNGRIDWEKLVYTNNSEEIEKYLLEDNDVLFNRTNSADLVGKATIYKRERPAIFAGYLIRIHRKNDLLDAGFLNYYLNSLKARAYGKTVMSCSVNQANINGSKLKQYPISIPALKTQEEFVVKIRKLEIKTQHLESIYKKKLTALAELKQSILQKAFAGELTSQPEKTVEEAVV